MNGKWKRTLSAGLAACLLSSCGMSAAREIPVSSETGKEAAVQWTEEEEIGFLTGLTAFTCKTASEFLAGEDENRLYSPSSLYLALAMTAQCAAGDTQSQLLELLGAEDLETFANSSATWFEGLNQESDEGTAALANSIWLREGFSYFPEPIETLNNLYRAQAFEADFSDAALPKDIGGWIQEATHGLLGKDASDFQPGADTQMILFSALYFKGAWSDPFSKENNSQGPFYKADGSASNGDTEYMNQKSGGLYWEGDGFAAGSRSMQNGARMLFILPDEDLSPEDLAAHPEVLRQVLFPENAEYAQITWRVPKFSVADSPTDIPQTLEGLGLTLPFSPYEADFSALSETPLYLSNIRQEATLTIDEEGCEGAAYTEVSADAAAAMEPKEVELNLNRPFLFAVVYQNTVLFTGIINNPSA